MTFIPKSCIQSYRSLTVSSVLSSTNDSAVIAQMSVSANSLLGSSIFWGLFTVGCGGVLLLSLPRMTTQVILRIMYLSQSGDET